MGASELRVVVRATQMSVGSPAGHVVTLMVSLSPIHRPVMALHMQPVYTVLLGHGQRGLLGGPVPVPVAPVHAHKSDLWRPIRFNDTEDVMIDDFPACVRHRLLVGTLARAK
jgi:hypothetical protein